jgi:hypothetical protein
MSKRSQAQALPKQREYAFCLTMFLSCSPKTALLSSDDSESPLMVSRSGMVIVPVVGVVILDLAVGGCWGLGRTFKFSGLFQ